MSPKPSESIERFTDLLVASGLVTVESLRTIMADFAADDAARGVSCSAFTTWLIVKGILTRWQCERPREGRYKGFFLDSYRIVDHLGSDDTYSRYLAEEVYTGRYVVLAVTPKAVVPPKDGVPHYIVEEYYADGLAEP